MPDLWKEQQASTNLIFVIYSSLKNKPFECSVYWKMFSDQSHIPSHMSRNHKDHSKSNEMCNTWNSSIIMEEFKKLFATYISRTIIPSNVIWILTREFKQLPANLNLVTRQGIASVTFARNFYFASDILKIIRLTFTKENIR